MVSVLALIAMDRVSTKCLDSNHVWTLFTDDLTIFVIQMYFVGFSNHNYKLFNVPSNNTSSLVIKSIHIHFLNTSGLLNAMVSYNLHFFYKNKYCEIFMS